MKLLYFPLILLLIYSIDLKSYSNLDTIIYQKKRIEFEVEFLNRNYWVESNLNELLLIKDYETGKNIRWDFLIYNKKLNAIYSEKILMDRSFTLYEKQSENKDFNILYKKEYSNEKEYLLIKIKSDSSKIVQHQIKLPISSTILDFIILDDLFIFSNTTKKGEYLLSIYNTKNKRYKNLHASLSINEKIITINKINSNKFEINVLTEKLDRSNSISKREYNIEGNEIERITISLNNKSIINGKFYKIDNNIIGIGFYGLMNSSSPQGIYISSHINQGMEFIKIYNFYELPKFYTNNNKQRKNILKKIKNNRFDKIRKNHNFVFNSFFKFNETFIFSAESLILNYNSDGKYSYIPFYNTYSGTYDKMINPNFKGYDHTKMLLTSFDLNGNINWNTTYKINNLNTFDKVIYFNNLIHKEKILSFYVSKGYFNYGLVNKINNKFTFKSIPLILKYKNDIIKETENNPEGTSLWYNNNYYTYGIQKIKNTLNTRVKINRRVFFISNFEIIK